MESNTQAKSQILGQIKEAFNDKDFRDMWFKMHTPIVRRFRKVRRNEICPFCESGKKYKKCECYIRAERNKYTFDEKHTKGWR